MKSAVAGCGGFVLGALFAVILLASAFFFLATDTPRALSVPTPGKPDISVAVSANYLNAQIKQIVAKSGIVKNPIVNLAAPNIVQVVGTFETTIAGQRITTKATLSLRLVVQNGRVALTVDQIELGSVPVPKTLIGSAVEGMRAQIEDQINALAQSALKGTSLKLLNVRIAPSELTIDLTSQ